MSQVVNLRKIKKSDQQLSSKKSGSLPAIQKIPTKSPEKVVLTPARSRIREEGYVDRAPQGMVWEAPSFYYNPQKRYLALTVIALISGSVAMILFHQDTLTAIFMMLSSLVLVLYANKRPVISRIAIDDKGVSVGENIYRYEELRSFWIDYTPNGPKELSLESKKWYIPYVKVSIERNNPLEIRSLMISFLPEREHEKSLVDYIGKNLGL